MVAKKKTAKKDHWADPRAVFGPKSKLINVDLASVFLNPLAWERLTDDQKKHLKDRLPPHISYDESGRPSFDFLNYDMNWKGDVRRFQEDIADGKYEPEWLAEAHQAMKDRADGKFDAWKLEQFEEHWGQKTTFEDHEFSGEMNEVQLEPLLMDGAFQEGDVWSYSRAFGKGAGAILVEYDAVLLEIDDYGKLKFSVAGNAASSPSKRSFDDAFNHDEDKISNSEFSIIVTKAERPNIPAARAPLEQHPVVKEELDVGIPCETETMQPHAGTTSFDDYSSPGRYNTRRNRTTVQRYDPSTPPKPKPKQTPQKPHFPLMLKITTPTELEKAIILADGRRKWDTRTDSWKRFYCKRNDKDLGSLWKLREQLFLRKTGKKPA